MARIKLHIPELILDTVTIPVRITDINYGNHLGNDSLVSIVHEARMKWLTNYNYSEMNVEGASLIMGDLAVEFLGESFYGDILSIDIAVGEITRVSFELFYSIQTVRNNKSIIIAKAKTGMICYDYKNRKLMEVPDKFKTFLSGS
ncbi:MAG: thioesterase family protein [Bacteroidetes bacterium]|nr:thioesterase family protein [Bacteroidota bacterium]